MARPPAAFPPRRERDPNEPRVDRDIRVDKVRLINENGDMMGVVSTRDALRSAEEAGLNLVEISPNADPPVCKILDYGKYKYELQKKASEARKKQQKVEVKEIQIRPMIGDHDYEVKLKNAKRFLEDGNKVKVVLKYRGREMAHTKIGFDLLTKMIEDIGDIGKIDAAPKMEGRQVMMVLSPGAAVKAAAPPAS
ncbi:MAG: translation initiation factor IF-3 [Micavibrio aeruginosavorus]|uniref:Translation initiation factor IF-3 n=1 Tax=Micavibrio aeruginosavorus TaxID=349221 RepID=A0A2W5FGD7_9BACT|nr:MAG: translation initiation factor IF-3 [Micavibrio aeruginosavorus]